MFEFLEDYEKLTKKIESVEDITPTDKLQDEKTLEVLFRKKTGKTFSHFYNIYYNKLVWFLQNKLHDLALSKDMADEAFMKALSKIEDYNEKYQFSTWLFIMGNNMSKDYLKKQKKISISSLDATNDEGHSILSTIEYKEDTDDYEHNKIMMKYNIMRKCIDNLSPKYKEVIEMRELNKMSYSEISKKLNIKEPTCKSRIRQGRLNLISAVKEQYEKIDSIY